MSFVTSSYIKIAFNIIRTAKLRNFWTMLGVIIGVSSFILIVGISQGIKLQIAHQIDQNGSDIISIRPSSVQVSGSSLDSLALFSGLSVSGSLTQNDLQTVRDSNGVGLVSPESAMTAKVSGTLSSYPSGLVIGTNSHLLRFLNQSLAYGSFLNAQTTTNQIVVGSQAASELFNQDVPLGQTVYINNQPFIVQGILNPFPSTPLSSGSEFNRAVFIQYNEAQNLTNGTITTFQILALPKNSKNLKKVQSTIYKNLLRAHNNQNNFLVLNQNQNLNSSSSVLKLLSNLVLGVSLVALIVGGIGIMNVMLVSITERYHEIGIRKAMGATNRQILNQFLIESTTLSSLGGIIGIILAYFIDLFMILFTNIRPSISLVIILIAFLISVIIGVVFGSFPALKAARKTPIDALRSE